MGLQEKMPQFSYISSGIINPDDALCISNTNLLDHLTHDDMFELVSEKIHSQEGAKHIIENLLSREIRETPTHIILLYNPEKTARKSALAWDTTALEKILSTIKQHGESFYGACKKNKQITRLVEEAKKRIDFNNKRLRSVLFGLGVVVCI